MKITIQGKTITISDKNARVYEKMKYMPIDTDEVRNYVWATYHEQNIEATINQLSVFELEKLVNDSIEQEARDCGGDKFYEES